MRIHAEDSVYNGETFTTLRGMPPELQEDYEHYLQEIDQQQNPSAIEDPHSHDESADLFFRLNEAQTQEADINGLTAWQKLALLFSRQREDSTSKAELKELGDPSLPINKRKAEILQAFETNRVVIIDAETGSGKTTQLPLWLHAMGKPVWHGHTSRLATNNAHDRHNYHAGEVFGKPWADEFVNLRTAVQAIGPQDAEMSDMTDGLLARILMDPTVELPQDLVVVLDECHQANKNQEKLFTLAADPRFQDRFVEKNVTFVIMSATGEIYEMQELFSDVQKNPVPILSVEGRVHDVDIKMEAASTKVEEALKAAKALAAEEIAPGDPNAILVFARGVQQINDAIGKIKKGLPKDIKKPITILPLYRSLSSEQQHRAIEHHEGITIIVSTNIAENSLTIPGLRYVIDDGKRNLDFVDEYGTTSLPCVDISQSEIIQRIGRVGRVVDGVYVLTREDKDGDFVSFDERDRFPIPEILRTDLSQDVLDWANLGYDMKDLKMLHVPEAASIERAKENLRNLGALDEHGQITKRGERMARFPLDTELARMLDESYKYNERTRLQMAAICAIAQAGSLPRYSSTSDEGQPWYGLLESTESDMLAGLDLFIAMQGKSRAELRAKDLNPLNFKEAETQFYKLARLMGVAEPALLKPKDSEERETLIDCIIAGLPNHVFVRTGSGEYTRLGRKDPSFRTPSTKSVLHGKGPAVIVGRAHDIKQDLKIIHNGTGTAFHRIAKVFGHLSTWKSDVTFDARNGVFVDVQTQHLWGESLKQTREVLAEPTPQVTEMLVEHMISNSFSYPYLRSLVESKKELERLQSRMHHRNPYAMKPLLSQDYLKALLQRAAGPNGTVPSDVDAQLGIILADEKISIDTFLSAEERAAVERDAPVCIAINGKQYGIDYIDKRPVITSIADEDLLDIDEDPTLPNGRIVLFRHFEKRGKWMKPRDVSLIAVKRARGLLAPDYV